MSTETNDQSAGQLNATAIAEIVGSAVKTALETIKSQLSQDEGEKAKEPEKDETKVSDGVEQYLQHQKENESLTGKSI